MKKLFAFLAASLIAVSMVPAVSAAESTSSDNTVYYYVDREGAMYELSEDQYTEVMTEDNLEMVVARDEVTPVSSMKGRDYVGETETTPDQEARYTGRWTFKDELVRDGYKLTFSQSGGRAFTVRVMPSKSAYLIAGASGSHPFETPAEYVTSDGGIVLTSEYPAGYKFYVINAYNGYDIEVDATIEVTKA